MKRRVFLTATAASVAGAGLAKPAIAQSTPEITWRLASVFPRSAEIIMGAASHMAQSVAALTDGKFKIQIFPAGSAEIGRNPIAAVTTGAVECAQAPLYALADKEPTFAFGTGIPFGFNARHQHSWWLTGGGREIITKELAKFNCTALVMGNSGTQMGGWFRKEINSVDDLKGLKFRIGGMGGDILARLGVEKITLPPGEVPAALENGTIDAAEFVGPADDEKLGLFKVAKYYYHPGWWEGGAMLHLMVHLKAWESLPASYRAALETAGEATNTWMLAQYDRSNPSALKRLIAQGVMLRRFPKPVLDACWQTAEAYYAELSATNPLFKSTLESHNAFRAEAMAYWRIAELDYDTMMSERLGR